MEYSSKVAAHVLYLNNEAVYTDIHTARWWQHSSTIVYISKTLELSFQTHRSCLAVANRHKVTALIIGKRETDCLPGVLQSRPHVLNFCFGCLSLTPSLFYFCGVFCQSLISTSVSNYLCVCVVFMWLHGAAWLHSCVCVSVCAADIWAQSIPHTSVSSNCLNPSSWEFTQETTHILYTAHTRKDTITNNAHAEQHTQSLPEHDRSLDVSGYVRLCLFAATPASCWTLFCSCSVFHGIFQQT